MTDSKALMKSTQSVRSRQSGTVTLAGKQSNGDPASTKCEEAPWIACRKHRCRQDGLTTNQSSHRLIKIIQTTNHKKTGPHEADLKTINYFLRL